MIFLTSNWERLNQLILTLANINIVELELIVRVLFVIYGLEVQLN